jgi:hypothetical protein
MGTLPNEDERYRKDAVMADEHNELRRVNWSEVFGFAHIFKSFRMAIHPSKLLLSLGAIVVFYVFGTLLGSVWSLGGQRVVPGQIDWHYQYPTWEYERRVEADHDARPGNVRRLWSAYGTLDRTLDRYRGALDTAYRRTLAQQGRFVGSEVGKVSTEFKTDHFDKAVEKVLGEPSKWTVAGEDLAKLNEKIQADSENDWASALDKAREDFEKHVGKIEEVLAHLNSLDPEDAVTNAEDSDDRREQFVRDRKIAWMALTRLRLDFYEGDGQIDGVYDIKGYHLFSAMLEYEWSCLHDALLAVRRGHVFSGLSSYRQLMQSKRIAPASVTYSVDPLTSPADVEAMGFAVHILRAAHGLCWLAYEHFLFAAVLLVGGLAICSYFLGAVHRIAALHFAREEKIPMTQAMRFACGKFFNYLTAPLIPLALIVLMGVVVFVGGLLLGMWGGKILLAVLLPFALVLGLIIAFLSVGLAAGSPLMFPTIAVEGSDSFDAISRSFSYVFAKPWRSLLYGLVALVYGAITYLFVRLFLLLALCSVHWFAGAGAGVWGSYGMSYRLHPDATEVDAVWTVPTFDNLVGAVNWQALEGAEFVGAALIGVWVFLVAGLAPAYLLSFFASASTSIYFLLRKNVDATDLDDVYVEEEEDELFAAEPEPEPADQGEGDAGGESQATGQQNQSGGESTPDEPNNQNTPGEGQ